MGSLASDSGAAPSDPQPNDASFLPPLPPPRQTSSSSSNTDGAVEYLTPEEIQFLAQIYAKLTLSRAQCDRLMGAWIAATKREERRLISQIYFKQFRDTDFVSRLTLRLQAHQQQQKQQQQQSSASSSSGILLGMTAQEQQQSLLHDTVVPLPNMLEGPGPFVFRFGLVSSDDDKQLAVGLYSTQFAYPKPPTLQQLVTVPRRLSTRTRKNVHGSHTWFLWSRTGNRMACCATVIVHRCSNGGNGAAFMEMPLFATAGGFQGNGLARVLVAGIIEFAVRTYPKDSSMVLLVSADPKAIPFWSHLGFRDISKREKDLLAFDYEHKCVKFDQSQVMVLSVGEMQAMVDKARQRHQAATMRMSGEEEDHCRPPHQTSKKRARTEGDEEVALVAAFEERDAPSYLVMEALQARPRLLLDGLPVLPTLE